MGKDAGGGSGVWVLGVLILPSLPYRGPGPRQEALLTPGPVLSSEAFPIQCSLLLWPQRTPQAA